MIKQMVSQECCGCTACVSICTHEAISMKSDILGFLHPEVDKTKCVDCGLCEKVCQFHPNYKRYNNYDTPLAYSLRLNDSNQLRRSQSGGAFYVCADYVLRNGGVVYGAAFTNTWRVTHQKATNHSELERIRMSKYVQSDMRGVFHQVKNDLLQGYIVLFSGTSCQVSGLKAYLPQKLHENLVCIDIICHGVPSPKIWEDYITYLEKKYKSNIINACFRDKRFGWHGAKETFVFSSGKEIVARTSNYLYFSRLSIRECCTKCYYTNTKRVGDITIGDHWGLPKDAPCEIDNLGQSLVLVNSEKGSAILNAVSDCVNAERVNLIDCMQDQLKHPVAMNPKHNVFVADYTKHGFLFIARKYGDLGLMYKIKAVKKIIKKILAH